MREVANPRPRAASRILAPQTHSALPRTWLQTARDRCSDLKQCMRAANQTQRKPTVMTCRMGGLLTYPIHCIPVIHRSEYGRAHLCHLGIDSSGQRIRATVCIRWG